MWHQLGNISERKFVQEGSVFNFQQADRLSGKCLVSPQLVWPGQLKIKLSLFLDRAKDPLEL
jgi:hypothetical protein